MNECMHKKEKNNKTTAHLSAFFFLGDLFCFNKSDTSQGEREKCCKPKRKAEHTEGAADSCSHEDVSSVAL